MLHRDALLRWRSRGQFGLVILAIAAVGLVAAPDHREASAAEETAVALRQPVPAPGALVPSGPVVVAVDLVGGEDLVAATVEVDDVAVAVGGDTTASRVVSEPVEVGTGSHDVRVLVETSAGDEVERTWRFTATSVRAQRLAGADRVATSVAIARDQAGAGQVPAAVLARADDFADALAGAPLAALVEGPLLLTAGDDLSPDVAEVLGDLLDEGGVVHLLGGDAALSEHVESDVEALGLQTRRHAGEDRYDTAARIAQEFPDATEAVVASGLSFPDALAASVPAARDGRPVLLVAPDRLPDATRGVLAERQPAVVVVGGEAVVGPEVYAELESAAAAIERVAGATRYETAAAVRDRWYATGDTARPSRIALADGTDFADALAATRHAAASGAPLLLVNGAELPQPTEDALREAGTVDVVAYGGERAVSEDAVRAAVAAITDGPAAVRAVGRTPAPGDTTRDLPNLEVAFASLVDASSTLVHVLVDGREVDAHLDQAEETDRLTVSLEVPQDLQLEEPYPVRMTLSVAAPTGERTHLDWSATLQLHDPVFATVGPVRLVEPSADVEFIGYHQSSHEGARQLDPNPRTSTPSMTMESRGRGTGLRTSADLVADEDVEVVAPVTGTVLRAGTYRLYCDHSDHYLVIEPDTRPGWEVKLLHFRGLRVGAGDRVEAGVTVVGDGPRVLPFESQVDEHSSSGHGPHLHVEVVDPSIPNVGGGSC